MFFGGGFLLSFVGLLGVFVFSASLFFNVSIIMVWLYLELSSLCVIPLFFSSASIVNFSSLFYYIVFSGVSSGLLLSGLLIPESIFFLLCGFLMKFGIFPLWGWIYYVFRYSNWIVIWSISTVLKTSFVFFSVFLVLSENYSVYPLVLCGFGCIFLSFFFWTYTTDWKMCWCHMMLSSSSVLVGLSISGCNLYELLFLFLIYFVWGSLVVFYFSFWSNYTMYNGIFSIVVFCFLLLSVPVSISIFYKIVVCSCIFSCGLFMLICWVVYSISEQFYLFLCITGLSSLKGCFPVNGFF